MCGIGIGIAIGFGYGLGNGLGTRIREWRVATWHSSKRCDPAYIRVCHTRIVVNVVVLFVAQQIEKHSGIDLFGMPLLSGQSIYEVNAE